jgi:hypothetical protein
MDTASRYNEIINISNILIWMDDMQISQVYNIMNKNAEETKARKNMIEYILSHMYITNNDIFNELCTYINKVREEENNKNRPKILDSGRKVIRLEASNDKEAIIIKKKNNDNDDENDDENDEVIDEEETDIPQNEKYRLALKFINKLLETIPGKQQITKLTEFKDIDKFDIATKENTEILVKMSKELFKIFDKRTCRYYPKKSKSWVLNVLRGMVKDVGYKLVIMQCDIYHGKYRRIGMMYTIKKLKQQKNDE